MKKIILPFFFICLFVLQTNACLNNYYSMDKEGNFYPLGDTWHFPFNKNFNLELNVTKLKKLEKKLKEEKNYMLLSDYAVCLMKIGKPKEALEILSELYKHYPNEFQLASNLGTAYELNGQNDSALKYIKRGLQLNPHDHEGSEWIHIKILETKQKLKTDPSYLDKHSVLELTNGQKTDSPIRKQLDLQLKERVPFTPGPDAIMVSLFNDLGDLSANLRSVEYAHAYYQLAKFYYGGKAELFDPKIKEMSKLVAKYSEKRPDQDNRRETMEIKIHTINYKEILTDNAKDYKINWNDVNINTAELLAMADLSKTVAEVKQTAATDTSDLKLIEEHKNTLDKKNTDAGNLIEKPVRSHFWLYIVIGLIVILSLLFYFIKRSKNN